MRRFTYHTSCWLGLLLTTFSFVRVAAADDPGASRHTTVSIVGDGFQINGRPTYAGRVWHGHKIEGLLLNSRMVQGIFDDLNPATVSRWAYPDTGKWDPERNTSEFIATMPEWRRHGLLAFTINLQGGAPIGYAKEQPWLNSAIAPDGALRPAYLNRLARILDRADELGMVAIVGYFYFGQDERIRDEAAVLRATDEATRWLLDRELPQRARRNQQRVQHRLRSRDPAARTRFGADRACAGHDAQRPSPAGQHLLWRRHGAP